MVARAEHFGRRHIGQALAGPVPDQHLLFGIEHESRHHQMLHQGDGEGQLLLLPTQRPGDPRNQFLRHPSPSCTMQPSTNEYE
jgi:hypothetical protein